MENERRVRFDKVFFETKDCVGCKTCVIACSFHHKGVFSVDLASIEIKDQREQGKFGIFFYKTNEEGHLACDKCQGEEEPFCVKYCNFIARDELRALLNTIWAIRF
jgi:Fe-S-cluster-containing hydrogenase component 2